MVRWQIKRRSFSFENQANTEIDPNISEERSVENDRLENFMRP